jgi:hypothetical protein
MITVNPLNFFGTWRESYSIIIKNIRICKDNNQHWLIGASHILLYENHKSQLNTEISGY